MARETKILSPVGSMQSFYAAMKADCDEIYMGSHLFNARRNAKNFSYDEIKTIIDIAHLFNKKVYITVNILLNDDEVTDALFMIKDLYNMGADAFIVQDSGLSYLVDKYITQAVKHSSTQMNAGNSYALDYLIENNFKRVVLPRESDIDFLNSVEDKDIELEIFCHGALCVCQSGQCFMSSFIGERSGNRGTCAQPCRKLYDIYSCGRKLDESKYYLSPRDLNVLEKISDLKGKVDALKIEGRMKSPKYVYISTAIYKKALKYSYYSISNEELEDLTKIFNRKFTKGHLFFESGKDYISSDLPKNRGLKIAEVKQKADKNYIRFDKDMKKGQILSYIEDKSISEFTLDRDFKSGETYLTNLKKGTEIYLYENNCDEDFYDISVDVDIEFEAYIDRSFKIKISGAGRNIKTESDYKVQKAIKNSLDYKEIENILRQSGRAYISPRNVSIYKDENIFIPLSKIKELRRAAYDKFLLGDRHKTDIEASKKNIKSINLNFRKTDDIKRGISLKFKENGALRYIDKDILSAVRRIYLPLSYEALNFFKDFDIKEKYFYLENTLSDDDIIFAEEFFKKHKEGGYGLEINDLGAYQAFKNDDINLHLSYGLNIYNSFSLLSFSSKNVKSFNPSIELNIKQLKNFSFSDIEMEIPVYGLATVMSVKNCPMESIFNCSHNCEECKFNADNKLVYDNKYEYKFYRKGKYTKILNSKPIYMLDKSQDLKDIKNGLYRIDIYDEEEVGDIIKRCERFLSGEDIQASHEFTRGHYYKELM